MTAAEERTRPVVAYLESTLGLSFTGPRRARLLSLIEDQRAAAGLSHEAFLCAIARPGPAFDRLVGEVTVGETSFFRDRAQCDLVRTLVLPGLRQRQLHHRPRLVMWSAGCASGEEAFTLAALAEEAGFGDECQVVGSDASARALQRAGQAVYGRWSMRTTTPEEMATWFHEQDGRWQVIDRLRRRTRFVQRNLLDGPPPPGRFDLVLCRNLLIYLTPEAVRRAAEVLMSSLTADGWLITAAGDPPLQGSGLEVVRTPFGGAYRRAEALGLPGVDPSPGRAARPVSTRKAPAVPARSPSRKPVTAPVPPTPVPPTADLLAEQVRVLGDSGRIDEACRTAAAAIEAHPLDVHLRYLSGVVMLEAGRLPDAAASAASAVYLAPQLPAAHLLLGQVEHARGNTDRARRCFRNASRLLATFPAEARVELAGDLPAGHLAAIASRYLSTHREGR